MRFSNPDRYAAPPRPARPAERHRRSDRAAWLVFCVYSRVVPPLVRRWLRRNWR
ncbi:hypothetical protein [Plantactinospora sp. BB1]|uniref:hypothetical protein n=1 Tax=Plantactinospora sp. BB1 TaxID=2071627 RepID=UPI00131F080F|nr:hypothetical protein [Plantactinospora sp. BB1]